MDLLKKKLIKGLEKGTQSTKLVNFVILFKEMILKLLRENENRASFCG